MRFLLNIPTTGWFLFSILWYILAEYWTKLWSMSPTWKLGLLAMAAYTVSSIGWFVIMAQRKQLVLMSMFWYMMAIAATIIVGHLIFGERLTMLQWTGVGTGLITLLLLSA